MYSIAILTPMFADVEPETRDFAQSIIDNPLFDAVWYKAKSSTIVGNRNKLLKMFIESGKDWALCLDSDNCTDIETLIDMIELNMPVLFGLYPNKFNGEEYLAGRFARNKDGHYYPQKNVLKTELTDKIISFLDWYGMGLTLIKRSTLECIEYPYIAQPPINMIDGTSEVMLEDVYFCRKLLDAGIIINGYYSEKIKHILRKADKQFKTRLGGKNMEQQKGYPRTLNEQNGSINQILASQNAAYQDIYIRCLQLEEENKKLKATIEQYNNQDTQNEQA